MNSLFSDSEVGKTGVTDEEAEMYINHDLENIVTPIDAKILTKYLRDSGYDEAESQFLVKGFTEGFSIEYEGPEN